MLKEKQYLFELILIVNAVIILFVPFVYSLRSPYYLTGKYSAQDVDTGTWSTVKTISNVSMIYKNLYFVCYIALCNFIKIKHGNMWNGNK